jgi:hypothetical protein
VANAAGGLAGNYLLLRLPLFIPRPHELQQLPAKTSTVVESLPNLRSDGSMFLLQDPQRTFLGIAVSFVAAYLVAILFPAETQSRVWVKIFRGLVADPRMRVYQQ